MSHVPGADESNARQTILWKEQSSLDETNAHWNLTACCWKGRARDGKIGVENCYLFLSWKDWMPLDHFPVVGAACLNASRPMHGAFDFLFSIHIRSIESFVTVG